MTKTCISIYNEFSNIGPTRRTWLWRLKVKYLYPHFHIKSYPEMAPYIGGHLAFYFKLNVIQVYNVL